MPTERQEYLRYVRHGLHLFTQEISVTDILIGMYYRGIKDGRLVNKKNKTYRRNNFSMLRLHYRYSKDTAFYAQKCSDNCYTSF